MLNDSNYPAWREGIQASFYLEFKEFSVLLKEDSTSFVDDSTKQMTATQQRNLDNDTSMSGIAWKSKVKAMATLDGQAEIQRR